MTATILDLTPAEKSDLHQIHGYPIPRHFILQTLSNRPLPETAESLRARRTLLMEQIDDCQKNIDHCQRPATTDVMGGPEVVARRVAFERQLISKRRDQIDAIERRLDAMEG